MVDGSVRLESGVVLMHRVSLNGPLTIGRDTVIYPGACIGYAPQDLKFARDEDGAGTIIGERNVLREGVTIHRATKDMPTTLGDDNYLMANSHLGHDVVVGNSCMIANGALLAGHVNMADKVVVGGNAAIHQFVRIGRLAIISGMAPITQDVTPFSMVYRTGELRALNLVGLRRNGLREHIDPLKRALRYAFHDGLPTPKAVELIESNLADDVLCQEFAAFIKGTQRGLQSGGRS